MKAAQKTINHGGERDAWLQYFECNWNLDGDGECVETWKGGRPSMHCPPFVSDCWMTVRMGGQANSDAGTNAHHHCIPIHLSTCLALHAPPCQWFPLASFIKLFAVGLENCGIFKLSSWWWLHRPIFEMITIAMTTMTIIDPHIIWREWPRKSGQKGVGEFLRCSQIVLCSWQL